MNCPYCSKELDLPMHAWLNTMTYQKPARVTTLCCGRGIVLTSMMTWRTAKYEGTETVDDWGQPMKETKS